MSLDFSYDFVSTRHRNDIFREWIGRLPVDWLDANTIGSSSIWIGASEAPAITREVVKEEFGFEPNSCILFYSGEFAPEHQEAVLLMLQCVVLLLHGEPGNGVLRFAEASAPVLQRRNAELQLNPEWFEATIFREGLPLIDLPYTMCPFLGPRIV